MEAIDFRIQLKPTAPMKLLEMLKHFLKVKGFLFLYPGSETKAALAPVNASRADTQAYCMGQCAY